MRGKEGLLPCPPARGERDLTKLLIADDKVQITSILEDYAHKEGYETLVCYDGEAALEAFREQGADLLLLDVMMPKLDGFSVCRKIRTFSQVPIILVTARGEDYEKIMGLEMGADDYIVKPFSPAEVMARVKAILRRVGSGEGSSSFVSYGDLVVRLSDYRALLKGKDLNLTKKEFEILWTLSSQPDRVFDRETLLSLVWGYDFFGDSRTVDSHVKRLRAKLSFFPHPDWEIRTIWGVGYSFSLTGQLPDQASDQLSNEGSELGSDQVSGQVKEEEEDGL